jgi:hypothetical protein
MDFLKSVIYFIKHGFRYEEVWGFDTACAKFVLPRLKELKKIKHGIPCGLKESEWHVILDKIIHAFKMQIEGVEKYDWPEELEKNLSSMYVDDRGIIQWRYRSKLADKQFKQIKDQERKLYKIQQEGFDLFGKYYNYLSD